MTSKSCFDIIFSGENMKKIFEVCIDSYESARIAKAARADRLEICSALSLGGLTPSAGLVASLSEMDIGKHVMIRPREGNFIYSDEELETMVRDIKFFRNMEVDGFVFGCLNEDCEIDKETLCYLVEAAGDKKICFHRAFDLIYDKKLALEILIDTGVDYVLSSGGETDVLKGVNELKKMNEIAGKNIIIIAGGGLTPENAGEIVHRAGVREYHASGRKNRKYLKTMKMGENDCEYVAADYEFLKKIGEVING